MSTDLQNLTKSELITRLRAEQKTAQSRLEQVEKLQQSLSNKDRLIAQFQRMIFGQKRERFEGDPNQGRLPFEVDPIMEKTREAYPPDQLHIGFEVLRIQRWHVIVFGLQDVGQHMGEPLCGVDSMQFACAQ